MHMLIGNKEGEHVTGEMEAGKVYGWDWLRSKGVRPKVCSWEGVRGEVGKPE